MYEIIRDRRLLDVFRNPFSGTVRTWSSRIISHGLIVVIPELPQRHISRRANLKIAIAGFRNPTQ
jgi:hypothetical protein